jgi:hypothetical protein
MHGKVWVNGQNIERFRTTYTNPFATHYNSKLYMRYMAALVPSHLIRHDSKFLDVRIDMGQSDHHIHMREMGTHDYN